MARADFDRRPPTVVGDRERLLGEIASGALKTVNDLLRTFSSVVKGMDPLGHDAVWRKLMSLTSPRPGGIGGWDGLPAPLPQSTTTRTGRASWCRPRMPSRYRASTDPSLDSRPAPVRQRSATMHSQSSMISSP